jgi:5-methylcytosine-specific restriction protein A
MPRERLSVDDVLAAIKRTSGSGLRLRTAHRAVTLAERLGAQPTPGHKSVAFRLPGPIGGKPDWLTLFVLSTGGTVYNDWHERWRKVGVSNESIRRYEKALKASLGSNFFLHPSAFARATDLAVVAEEWKSFERAVRRAARAIRIAVDDRVRHGVNSSAMGGRIEALEGQLIERRIMTRGRNAPLRQKALAMSDGKCEACGTNFGMLLGGRGWRVLQVHHRNQLSDLSEPTITKTEDLAVVCANCHLLIHADRAAPLPLEALRAQLEMTSAHRR